MCISMQPSEMSSTKLYAGEATRGATYVHVLAYQNHAKTRGPNAMILPIPARGELGPENVIDTSSFKHFLDDITEATRRQTRGARGMDVDLSLSQGAQVFDVGSYTVVLARRPNDVGEALARAPAAKRPERREDVLISYNVNYPGSWLAMCCWNGAIEAEPLLWWYEPANPELLFAPALDAHDGRAPQFERAVKVDHHVSFGSTLARSCFPPVSTYRTANSNKTSPVLYSDTIPSSVQELLPRAVVGTHVTGAMPNGDFVLPTISEGPAERRDPHRLGAAPIPIPLLGWS